MELLVPLWNVCACWGLCLFKFTSLHSTVLFPGELLCQREGEPLLLGPHFLFHSRLWKEGQERSGTQQIGTQYLLTHPGEQGFRLRSLGDSWFPPHTLFVTQCKVNTIFRNNLRPKWLHQHSVLCGLTLGILIIFKQSPMFSLYPGPCRFCNQSCP
jgi:hypothetical protein